MAANGRVESPQPLSACAAACLTSTEESDAAERLRRAVALEQKLRRHKRWERGAALPGALKRRGNPPPGRETSAAGE